MEDDLGDPPTAAQRGRRGTGERKGEMRVKGEREVGRGEVRGKEEEVQGMQSERKDRTEVRAGVVRM